VFPSPAKTGAPLSDMTLAAVLKRMGRGDLTVHGFRSTFRDWAGEATAHPREAIEAALAHRLQDRAEAAYARRDLFAKRRKLMEDWAAHLAHAEAGAVRVPKRRPS
jgi:integrase